MQMFRQYDFHPAFFIGLAIVFLILPLQWLLALITAALFHELCHLVALKLCGGQFRSIQFADRGAVIRASPLSAGKALFCSLAGPIGSLLLLPLARRLPRLAVCAAIQSAYNLLPLRGLDGGHALYYFLTLLLPPHAAQKICRVTQQLFLILLILFCLYASLILRLGWLPILAAVDLLIRGTRGNIPCKTQPLRVQ